MNQALLLYGLRLLSGSLLLIFLAAMAWLVYQDLRLSADISQRQRSFGHLRVIASKESGLGVNTLFPLIPVTILLRALRYTIVIEDGYVSSQHAMIMRRGKQWWLEDLGSRNGTLLNDLLLTEPVVISAGDVIVLGDTRLKIEPEQTS